MDRTQRLLGSLTKQARLIEVGPSFNPLVPKKDGWNTFVIDHASRADLIAKYNNDPSVDTNLIEEVDFVWQSGSLANAVPAEHYGTFDAFIASHVIEHTTDIITFLKAAETLIHPDGLIILAVPDKRKCFDFYRYPSTTADAIVAFQEERIRHDTRTHFEYAMRTVHKGGNPGWFATDNREAVLHRPFEQAHQQLMTAARHEYIDAHNWVFVPASFQLILVELSNMGYVNVRIEEVAEASGSEFYVWLRKGRISIGPDELQIIRKNLMDLIIIELAQQVKQLPENSLHKLERKNVSIDRYNELHYQMEATQMVLSAVLESTSWRGLDQKTFKNKIREMSRSIPNSGPAAVQHAVLLNGARKVLGLEE